MATRIAIICLAVFVFAQLYSAAAMPQDTTPKTQDSDAGKVIDDAVDSLKNTFDNILKNIQDSDVLKDLNKNMNKLIEDVQTQGKQLVDKIQATGKN